MGRCSRRVGLGLQPPLLPLVPLAGLLWLGAVEGRWWVLCSDLVCSVFVLWMAALFAVAAVAVVAAVAAVAAVVFAAQVCELLDWAGEPTPRGRWVVVNA